MQEPIIILEYLLKYWKDDVINIRKICSGLKRFNSLNLNTILKNNEKRNICNKRFNYTKKANRCSFCSSFCMLTENGEPCEKEIDIGEIMLTTTKHELPDEILSFQESNNSIHVKNLQIFKRSEYFLQQEMTYQKIILKNPNMRRVLFCSIIGWLKVDNPLVAAYLCDNFVIVKKVGKYKITSYGERELIAILKKIYKLGCEFIHGQESMEFLDIYIKEREIIVQITPCESSSFLINGYYDTKVFLPSKYYDENYEESFPIDVLIRKRPSTHRMIADFPVMDEYQELTIFVIRMTRELFEYYKNTCYNIFPQFKLYLWVIVLMSDRNIYQSFTDELLNLFFFEEDILKLRGEIPRLHMIEKCTHEQIKEFCIEMNFAMKFEIRSLLKSFIQNKDE